MPINLLKPLGTDIYDINIFNENATTIENYINQLLDHLDISVEGAVTLQVVRYNENTVPSGTIINIDELQDSIAICRTPDSGFGGTLPTVATETFIILTLNDTGNMSYQILFDASLNNSNKLYSRIKPSGEAWNKWKDLSGGGGGGNIELKLVDL